MQFSAAVVLPPAGFGSGSSGFRLPAVFGAAVYASGLDEASNRNFSSGWTDFSLPPAMCFMFCFAEVPGLKEWAHQKRWFERTKTNCVDLRV